MNYPVAMYQVLKAIEISSYENIDVYSLIDLEKMKITETQLRIVVSNILNEGLAIEPNNSDFRILSGSKKSDTSILYKPHLTTAGYTFLAENSEMKKAYKLLKEIKGWIPSLN